MLKNHTSSQFQSFSGADFDFVFYIPVSLSLEKISTIRKKISDAANALLLTSKNEQLTIADPGYRQLLAYAKIEESLKKFENGKIPVPMRNIQTLSTQIHTDIQPARALKFKYPKGYSVGQRLIAGSVICTVLDEHPFQEIMEFNNVINYLLATNDETYEFRSSIEGLLGLDDSSSVVDEIPPLNVLISGKNEQGDVVESTIYGLKLINDGFVISSQNMLTEQTFSFVAQDIDLLRNIRRGDRNFNNNILNIKSGKSILNSDLVKARQRFKRGFNL